MLREEWDIATDFMKKSGPDGSVKRVDYKDWPLFREFRDRPEFGSGYLSIFGDEFVDSNTQATVKTVPAHAESLLTAAASEGDMDIQSTSDEKLT